MSQKVEIDGQQVEVFTTEEVAAREAAARATVEGEYKPQVAELTTKLTESEKRAAERAGEFAQFRKLSEEQVVKLSVAERALYDNQLQLDQERQITAGNNKKAHEAAVASAIRAKVGNNADVFAKVKDMYDIVALEDLTPEQIAIRVNAALGALGQTAPDLLATVGLTPGGNFEVPMRAKEKESFADTDAGKDLASRLGLQMEEKK